MKIEDRDREAAKWCVRDIARDDERWEHVRQRAETIAATIARPLMDDMTGTEAAFTLAIVVAIVERCIVEASAVGAAGEGEEEAAMMTRAVFLAGLPDHERVPQLLASVRVPS